MISIIVSLIFIRIADGNNLWEAYSRKQPLTTEASFTGDDDSKLLLNETLGITSYHICLNQLSALTYKRCQIFNLCSYKQELIYILGNTDDAQGSLVRRGHVGFIREGVRELISEKKSQLFWADTDGVNIFSPKIVKSSIEQYAREHGATSVLWHDRPAYILNKRACTNAGHCLMENLVPIVTNMLIWGSDSQGGSGHGKNWLNNDIILMEKNAKECGCTSNPKACGSPDKLTPHNINLCNLYTEMYIGAASLNKVRYLDTMLSSNSTVMECWDRAYGGTGASGPYRNPNQMETLAYFYWQTRDLLYARNDVKKRTTAMRRDELFCSSAHVDDAVQPIVLNVIIGKKKGKRIITNIADVVRWVEKHAFCLNGMVGASSRRISRRICGGQSASWTQKRLEHLCVKYNVTSLEWEHIPDFKKQLQLLSNTDIFISTPGSGAMNAILLPDWASLITAPFCDSIDCEAFEIFSVHEHQVHYDSFVYDIDFKTETVASSLWNNPNILFKNSTKLLTILEQASYSTLTRLLL